MGSKVEKVEVVDEQEVREKKKQKQSVSYALKAISGHVRTLLDNELLNEEDSTTMIALKNKAVQAYIRKEYK